MTRHPSILALAFTAAALLSSPLYAQGGPTQAASPCSSVDEKSGRTYTGTRSEIELHASPAAGSPKLINKKASEVLKTRTYLTLDKTTTVTEECRRGEWSRVRVVEPKWLSATHIGWVMSKDLKEKSKDGIRSFSENDFRWDRKTAPHKATIIAGVNKAHRENKLCKEIDPQSAYISGSKGTPANPVFFVTCGSGALSTNVFFSKSDVESDTKLSAPENLAEREAISACRAYALTVASHPSTVSQFKVVNLDSHPNGRTRMLATFKARNGFNLELSHNVSCLFEGAKFIEATVWESGK